MNRANPLVLKQTGFSLLEILITVTLVATIVSFTSFLWTSASQKTTTTHIETALLQHYLWARTFILQVNAGQSQPDKLAQLPSVLVLGHTTVQLTYSYNQKELHMKARVPLTASHCAFEFDTQYLRANLSYCDVP